MLDMTSWHLRWAANPTSSLTRSPALFAINVLACPNVCRFITCGRYNEYNYLVMELLGDNLSELRRKTSTGKFSLATALMLGIVFVRSLEQIHDLGYLHRDVKPSNFVIGNEGRRNQVFLIDFGLARKFVGPDGAIRPARDQAGFRGTARYASINSHMSRDLGRRDDLWSVLYILIEMVKGFLPWRKLKEKDEIRDIKIKMNTPELVDELPKEFLQFMDHLQALDYADRPDYDYVIQLFQHRLKLIGSDEHAPYDWEVGANNADSLLTSSGQGVINEGLSIPSRPDSAGRPVASSDGYPPPAGGDPDNPVVYKLVAGGRRGQPAVTSEDDDADDPAIASPARPLTDSAEDGRRGQADDDGSDLLGLDDDDNISASGEAAKPRAKPTPSSSPAANSTPSSSKPKPSASEEELEDLNQQPNNGASKGQMRQTSEHDSTAKCRCTIL